MTDLFCIIAAVCGVPAIKPYIPKGPSRIIGGTEAVPNSWPWTGALVSAGTPFSIYIHAFIPVKNL